MRSPVVTSVQNNKKEILFRPHNLINKHPLFTFTFETCFVMGPSLV